MGFTPNWPVNYDPSPGEWSSMWASKLDQTNTILQTWTTATRPTSPTAGQIGFNTTIPSFEWWSGAAWITPSSGAFLPLTGGTLTGGLTITTGGVTISAGGIAATGNSTITGTLQVTQQVTLSTTAGILGTTAADSAQAGAIGEYQQVTVAATTATVTITIASPGVITWTAHGLAALTPIQFTTTGALPTGLAVATNYYILPGATLTTNTFQLATNIANAIAGTAINTSGTQSGTQTAFSQAVVGNGQPRDICGLNLSAGDWECWGVVGSANAGTATIQAITAWVSITSDTIPSAGTAALSGLNNSSGFSTTGSVFLSTGRLRVNVSSSQKVSLGGQLGTNANTSLFGTLCARRMR